MFTAHLISLVAVLSVAVPLILLASLVVLS
jgi:hypothetical protein